MAPRRLFRSLGPVLVLLGGLAVSCGGGQTVTDAAKKTDTTVAGATRAGGSGGGSGVATAAPLKVPGIGGDTVKMVRHDAEEKFGLLCGGPVCVKFQIVPPAKDDCSVASVTTEPPKGSRVERGSVVKLLVKLESDCAPAPATTPSTKSTTQSPTTTRPQTATSRPLTATTR